MSEMTDKLDKIKTAFKRLDKDQTTVINGIFHSACTKGGYYYWPLCLDDRRDKNSFEIDTCSTSYCISTLATMKSKGLSNDLINEIDKYISGGLKTLLQLLNPKNGTFPPVILVEKIKDSANYQGGIAMSDNYFVLSALIDAGFLDEEVNYNLPKKFKDRVDIISTTVNYFKDTMVHPSYDIAKTYGGWYYTNEKGKQPKFLTTANVILVLTKILKKLSKYNDDYLKEITTIKWVLEKAGAFLDHELSFDNGEANRVSAVNACKMVDAMIAIHKRDFDDNIIYALNEIILPNCNDDYLNDTYNYSTRYQILTDNKKYQNILHESYPESMMLYTLVNVIKYSLQHDTSIELKKYVVGNMQNLLAKIEFLMNKLISLKNSVSSEIGTLFKSHIRRNDGDYPIYASAESYRAINAWADLAMLFDDGLPNDQLDLYVIEQFKSNEDFSETEIDLLKGVNAQLEKIDRCKLNGNYSSTNSAREAKAVHDKFLSIKIKIITGTADIIHLKTIYDDLLDHAKIRGIITE